MRFDVLSDHRPYTVQRVGGQEMGTRELVREFHFICIVLALTRTVEVGAQLADCRDCVQILGCCCRQSYDYRQLAIYCPKRLDVPEDVINLYLEQTRFLVNNLTISNTSLGRVPTAVCEMTMLNSLNLDYNQVAKLPVTCLQNLANLTYLSAANNRIASLDSGFFDRLHRLETVRLTHNSIESIGATVFSATSPLKLIDLSHNKLNSTEM